MGGMSQRIWGPIPSIISSLPGYRHFYRWYQSINAYRGARSSRAWVAGRLRIPLTGCAPNVGLCLPAATGMEVAGVACPWFELLMLCLVRVNE